jgi:hypothetical protein
MAERSVEHQRHRLESAVRVIAERSRRKPILIQEKKRIGFLPLTRVENRADAVTASGRDLLRLGDSRYVTSHRRMLV